MIKYILTINLWELSVSTQNTVFKKIERVLKGFKMKPLQVLLDFTKWLEKVKVSQDTGDFPFFLKVEIRWKNIRVLRTLSTVIKFLLIVALKKEKEKIYVTHYRAVLNYDNAFRAFRVPAIIYRSCFFIIHITINKSPFQNSIY